MNITEIHNVYNTTVVYNNDNHVSYNGGNGGINERPTPQEEAAAHERHIRPIAAQTQHIQAARSIPQLRASANMGKPPVAATPRPGEFKGSVVAAREAGGKYTPPANRGGNRAGNEARAGNRPENTGNRPENNGGRSHPPAHVRDLPLAERPSPPNTGSAKQDQKYQQQQEKLYAKQQQERQKIARQQQKEDQRMAKQNANEAKQQQTEQRHQQQTQQLQQRHQQQQQQMQQRIQPAPRPEAKPPSKPPH